MTRIRVGTSKGNNFEAAAVARRCVALCVAHQFEEPGVSELRREHGEPPWDDMWVRERLSDGRDRTSCWQLKDLADTLPLPKLVELVEALRAPREFDRGVLGLARHVKVPGAGTTGGLAKLCNRIHSSSDTRMALTGLYKAEEAWLDVLCEHLKADRTEVGAVLRHFHVEEVGAEETIQKAANVDLRQLFTCEPSAPWNAVLHYVTHLDDVTSVCAKDLQDGPFAPFLQYARPTPPTVAACRSRYLMELVADLAKRTPLAGMMGPGTSLEHVWVDVGQVAGPPRSLEADVHRPLLDEVRQGLPGSPIHIAVYGGVGSGKTELLHQTAKELAAAAQSDDSAPLPVLLRARDLVSVGWERAVHVLWPQLEAEVQHLEQDLRTHWVLLIDGMDEADSSAAMVIGRIERKFGGKLHGVVVATRPTVQVALEQQRDIWLEPWSLGAREQFRQLWNDAIASPARRVGRSLMMDSDLSQLPLTATMCMEVAVDRPDALSSRAALFDAITNRLFDDWASQRPDTSASLTWAEVAPPVERLALQSIRSGSPLAAADLDYALRAGLGRHWHRAQRYVERELGLLVRRDEQYEFALRSVEEHLAGRCLSEGTEDELVATAGTRWGAEPVRHGMGWLALTRPDKVVPRMIALTANDEDVRPGLGDPHLRRVLAAVYAAADSGHAAAPVAERLGDCVMRRLADEESMWVGERTADAVRSLARAGGQCWDVLQPQIADKLRDPRDQATWYEAQQWDTADQWLELRFHRNPRVRSIMASRLARWVNEHRVLLALRALLDDEAADPIPMPPAIAAGMALAAAHRSKAFDKHVRQFLRARIGDWQLQTLAAAAALRPEEVGRGRTEKVRAELANSGELYGVPQEVFARWRVVQRRSYVHPARQDAPGDGSSAPSSQAVRIRLARALGPSLRDAPEELRALVLRFPAVVAPEAVCELAPDYPEVLEHVLTPAGVQSTILSKTAQRWIGIAAHHHPDVRDRLVSLWKQCRDDRHVAGRYPAHALEPLIRDGDEGAAYAYAEWLPNCRRFMGLFGFPLPAADVIGREPVRSSARRIADTLWGQVNEGGEKSVSRRTAGTILKDLAPAWWDDPAYRQGLVEWTKTVDGAGLLRLDSYIGGLMALQPLHLSADEKALVGSRFAPLFEVFWKEPYLGLRAPTLLSLAGDAGIVPYIDQRLLYHLCEPGSHLAPHTAAILTPHLDADEADRVSAAVGRKAWRAYDPDAIDALPLKTLVRRAPEAWASSLRDGIDQRALTNSQIAWNLFALPEPFRTEVARYWMQVVADVELPWTQDESSTMRRPADRVRGELFELGIE